MEYNEAMTLGEMLAPKQINFILKQTMGDGWQLVDSKIEPASLHGLSGFLGDHFRITLNGKLEEYSKRVNLFIKCLSLANGPKAKFIDENNFYRREMIMFELFRKMQADIDKSNPWCTQAYICSDNIFVMPDLTYQGYRQRPVLEYLDLEHTLITTASIARFHAAFAKYETKRISGGSLPFNREYAHLLNEPTFKDSPWLYAAAKLTKNFLTAFSDKCGQYPIDLEEILVKLFIEACGSLTVSDSLNVVNHKDLWINNIMYRYEGENPVNALLIDFQCIQYGPPAFDLMIFLYFNTSRSFREKFECMIFKHYYDIFIDNLDESTKERLKMLGYDFDVFVVWCHRARMFSVMEAIGIFPYTLMEPSVAKDTFDNPQTFLKHYNEDRSEPVLAHARMCAAYKHRELEVCEEFVERYVV